MKKNTHTHTQKVFPFQNQPISSFLTSLKRKKKKINKEDQTLIILKNFIQTQKINEKKKKKHLYYFMKIPHSPKCKIMLDIDRQIKRQRRGKKIIRFKM